MGWKRRLAAPVLVVAFGLGYVNSQVNAMLRKEFWAAATNLVYAASLQELRAADSAALHWYHASPKADDSWVAWWAGYKALLGFAWVNPQLKTLDLSWLTRPSDKDSEFCYQLLGYMWVHPSQGLYAYPSIYAGYEDTQEWIKACKKVWPDLGDEEKALLQPFRSAGSIPLDVLVPSRHDRDTVRARAREAAALPLCENTERMSREEIEQVLQDSIARSVYGYFVKDPPKDIVDYYSTMNMRKVMEIPADWGEVGKAIRAGQIAKFDATKLIDAELFNITLAKMRHREGHDASKRIPVFSDNILPASLSHFADGKAPHMRAPYRHTATTIADEGMVTVNGRPGGFDWQVYAQTLSPAYRKEAPSPAGYVHTRRLPKFHERLPDVEKLIGIQEEVLRGQSMLWMGATPGGIHYDEEPNVYFQLSGETFAFLIPQNYSEYFTGANRHPWMSAGLPGIHELAEDPVLKTVPIYLITLRPGDGLTLPGRTYHRFLAQTMDRISLNWFFIPGWRKMEYNPADWYSIEAGQSLTRLAVRQLWARTIARLFDDTGRGVVYMGTKLEYL